MSDTRKMQATDVKNEVNRIKKLPKDEQEGQMEILYNKLKLDIGNYYDIINSLDKSEQREEYNRITKALRQLKWKWRWRMAKYVGVKAAAWKNSDQFIEKDEKIKTAHVSGLPLPEQAEVDVWWQDNKLIFASASTEFSLPVERVMGMGTTREESPHYSWASKTYLTIEYKKMDEIKSIVVRATYRKDFYPLINCFNQIKGTREMNKKEL